MDDFSNKEERILEKVEPATKEVVRELYDLLKPPEIRTSIGMDGINSIDNNIGGNNEDIIDNNGGNNENGNGKKLVRTFGAHSNGTLQGSTNVPANPNPTNPINSTNPINPINSQIGNASTGTLILIFSMILILLVLAVSYCIFNYLGF